MDNKKRLKNIWYCMKRRCLNPAPSDFRNGIAACYHDRGITVCKEWASDFESFFDWALKNGYADDLTIDRIDPDKGYSPDNCRWIPLLDNLKRARKVAISGVARDKSRNYFIANHYCGSSWAIVKDTRLPYSDAIKKRYEADRKRGWVVLVLRHGKDYRGVKPGDMIDFPIQNRG